MKKCTILLHFILLLIVAGWQVGCLKDTATRTYTIYQPVYKSMQEVRANIKNDVAGPFIHPGKIVIMGKYIFVNEVDKGIHIIDNSNPAAPVNKFFIAIPGNLDLAVKGNILYADLYSDLVAIDISDPARVRVEKVIENVFPARTYSNGFVADSNRVIVDWVKKDTTVATENNNWMRRDLWLFNSPVAALASNAKANAGIGGSMARFTILNNYLYAVTNSNLNVFNITEPANPSFTNKVPVGWQVETIFPFQDNLFIGSQTGMYIFSASNAAQPKMLSQFSHARVCDPVIADGRHAYVTLRTGTNCFGTINQLVVLDIANLTQPILVQTYNLTNPHGLSKDGDLLFICDGAAGLKVFDASNVKIIKLLQTFAGLSAYDVIAHNGLAIVVANEGLYQYNYTNPQNVTLLSKVSYKQ